MWKGYVIDKDGTLIHEGRPVDGAREFLESLRDVPHVILSNTGEKTAEQVAAEISRVVGTEVLPYRVCTAYDCIRCALRMQQRVATLDDLYTDEDPHVVAIMSDGHISEFCDRVSRVVRLVEQGSELWMTSTDASIIDMQGRRRPGPGVFLQAVEATLGRPVRTLRVFGKGGNASHAMISRASASLTAQGFVGSKRDVLMIGDRFDTDVRIGSGVGWSTCLVESGCHTCDDASMFPTDIADFVASSVRDLVKRDPSFGMYMARLVCSKRLTKLLCSKPRRIQSDPQLYATHRHDHDGDVEDD